MSEPAAAPELAAALSEAGVRDVSVTTTDRAAYSSDASIFRLVPSAVVKPHDADEVAAVLAVCRTLGVPLTARGAGTSIAGNAVGTGVILDFSRHMNEVLEIDKESRSARVQPGVVHAKLQKAAAPYGLRFGPDPSSHTRCTIGGMIGNNACGSRALAYGRTADNVLALSALTAAGERLALDGTDSEAFPRLRDIAYGGLATIRTEFGRFGRQVSGYALEHLLPENGFDVRRLLVGSEGTLAVVTEATMRLVEEPGARVLTVLGYPDMASAADAIPAVLPYGPTACEGIDSRIVNAAATKAAATGGSVPPLPQGGGWLFVELTGDTEEEAVAAGERLLGEAGALDGQVVADKAHAARLWRIREDGAGLAGVSPAGLPAYAGWEDSAVPPEKLGPYLRDLEALMAEHGLSGIPYGHFGDGCLHLRLDFPLTERDRSGVLRAFMTEAAGLVARYGGSLSGEHGDGQARGELLPTMYSPRAIDIFAQVKAAFDPDDVLNPGVLVEPAPLDADVRAAGERPMPGALGLALHADKSDFSAAVHRCTGVGKCRADSAATGGIMCPSYQATRDETHSTRGRARVLEEMVNGTFVKGGWRAEEVHEALDLCLSCKACGSECPAGVDMATYKSEVLHQSYKGRLRPRSHYALGRLPQWARLASRFPKLANASLTVDLLARAARWTAGVDQRRDLPTFAPKTFRAWFAAHASERATEGRPVVLWPDTFTDHFTPEIGISAVRVLERAGFVVSLPETTACCALTWISTGQLDKAKKIIGATVADLAPSAEQGIPIVGLEPSCTATLRSDAAELLGTPAADAVASGTYTLAELLATVEDYEPPNLDGLSVVAQPHCHHSAVLGWDADAALLRRTGASVKKVGGCCGLAGNFGVEKGHYEVSVAVAETALLPAVREATEATILADGFSCRTQLTDLADRPALHLAQLLEPPAGPDAS